jgi:hypothetical protein
MNLHMHCHSAAERRTLPGPRQRAMACLFHHIFQQLGPAHAQDQECHSVMPVETTADFGNDGGKLPA